MMQSARMHAVMMANIPRLLVWALLAQDALAQEPAAPADLPPTDVAIAWLLQDADVMAAEAGRDAAGYEATQLRVSPNEWSLRLSMADRNYDTGPDSDDEWSAQLERPVRLPNKARIDRGLAATAEELGEARYGEAVHEAARSLVDLWMGWIEAKQVQALLNEQVHVAE